MRLQIKKSSTANIIDLIRRCGYSYRGRQGEEIIFVRRAGLSEYPRFHIYLKEESDGFILNLHLDQKRASYAGSRAHSGEHEGELIEKEAERVKGIIL
jgi:hypothetical protein